MLTAQFIGKFRSKLYASAIDIVLRSWWLPCQWQGLAAEVCFSCIVFFRTYCVFSFKMLRRVITHIVGLYYRLSDSIKELIGYVGVSKVGLLKLEYVCFFGWLVVVGFLFVFCCFFSAAWKRDRYNVNIRSGRAPFRYPTIAHLSDI